MSLSRTDDSTDPLRPRTGPRPALADGASRPTTGSTELVRLALYGLAIVVLAATTAFVAASLQPDVWGTRTEILFERRSELSTGFLREDRNLTTQLVTLRSRAVLGPVASANGLRVDDLSNKLEVSIVDTSEVIRVQVNDRSIERGAALVSGITERYLAIADAPAPGETQRFLEAEEAEIERELAQLTAQSAELELNRLARATGADPNPLPTPVQALVNAQIASLLDQRSEIATQLSAATIDFINRPRVAQITDAYTLGNPVSPRPSYAAVAGGMAGAVIAVITVAVLARRRGNPSSDT